jgi:flagellar biosynthesis/type III secretory pathway M-ring protein FliF/YscJ
MAAVMNTATNAASTRDPAGLDAEAIGSRVERSLTTKVGKLIDDFPERAIEVVRGWLAEDRH